MLPRAHRLTSSRSFATAIRRGRRAGGRTLVVHLAADPGHEEPRAGLVVGKVVGDAVTRNRVKRRIRHLLRDRMGALPAGSLVVVRALPPAATATSDTLGRALDDALGRLTRTARP